MRGTLKMIRSTHREIDLNSDKKSLIICPNLRGLNYCSFCTHFFGLMEIHEIIVQLIRRRYVDKVEYVHLE